MGPTVNDRFICCCCCWRYFAEVATVDDAYQNNRSLFIFTFRLKNGASYLERGRESRLVIDNVTYDYQGEYECRATNYINGQERTTTSEPVSLQVVGMYATKNTIFFFAQNKPKIVCLTPELIKLIFDVVERKRNRNVKIIIFV